MSIKDVGKFICEGSQDASEISHLLKDLGNGSELGGLNEVYQHIPIPKAIAIAFASVGVFEVGKIVVQKIKKMTYIDKKVQETQNNIKNERGNL